MAERTTGVYTAAEREALAKSQAEAEARIRTQASQQRTKVEYQKGDIERQAQASKGELRTYKRQQERKMQIPGRGGVAIIKPAIRRIEREKQRITANLTKLEADIDTAEGAALADIQRQVDAAQRSLDEYDKQVIQLETQAKAYNQAVSKVDIDTSQYIKLSTGEWVDRAYYERLTEIDKKILNSKGIDAFNRALEQRVTATTYILDTGEVVSRREYNALSAEQKAFMNEHGIDNFNRYYGALAYIQQHPDWFYYNAETQKWGTYDLRSTMLGIQPVKGNIFGVPVPASFEAGLNAIGQFFYPTPEETEGSYWDRFKGVAGRFAPVYSTIKQWDNMEDWQKGLSIAGDLLFFYPVIRGGSKIIANMAKSAKGVNTASIVKALRVQEFNLTGETAQAIKTKFGKPVSIKFQNVNAAQNKYLEALAKLDKLTHAKRANSARIAKASEAVSDLRYKLINVADDFADAIKATGKFGADDYRVISLYNGMGRQLADHTDSLFDSLRTTKPKASIAELEDAVKKASKAFYDVKEQFPLDPSKWVDKIDDLTQAELRLASVKSGDLVKLHNKIIALNEAIEKETDAVKATRLIFERDRLKVELDKSVKRLSVLWGRGGDIPRGGGRALTQPKPLPQGGVGSRTQVTSPTISTMQTPRGSVRVLTKTKTLPQTSPAISTWQAPISTMQTPRMGVSGAIIATAGKIGTTPKTATEVFVEQVVKLSGVTKTAAETITKTAVEQATRLQLAGYTKAQISAATEAYIKTALSQATLTETQLKTLTKTAVKVATKVATKVEAKPTKAKRPAAPRWDKPEVDISTLLTPEQLLASVAWKQGFMYKLIYPPYGEKDIINTREPIAGVKYFEGARSAYLSLTKLYDGEIPERIQRDMGIMDIEIERGGQSLSGRSYKPKMRFRRDRYQRTTLTPKVGTYK